jgi:hypothetical protein
MYIKLKEDDAAIVLRRKGDGVEEELFIPHEEKDDAPMEEAHYRIAFYVWCMQQPHVWKEFNEHMDEEGD